MSDKPCINHKIKRMTFSDAVTKHLNDKKITQADLTVKGNLSRTTVGRICRNKNDKGRIYTPTRRMVMTVCVALGLNKAEKNELMRIAFPEEEAWDEIIEKGMNIIDANILLAKHLMKPLGTSE